MIHDQEQIERVQAGLLSLGRGPEFDRGMTTLTTMIRRERNKTPTADVMAAARCLLFLERGEFAQGVFAMCLALFGWAWTKQLVVQTLQLRRAAGGITWQIEDGRA